MPFVGLICPWEHVLFLTVVPIRPYLSVVTFGRVLEEGPNVSNFNPSQTSDLFVHQPFSCRKTLQGFPLR